MKTQERIGSIPGLTPPGWLYGFLFRLKPLKTDSSFPDLAFGLSLLLLLRKSLGRGLRQTAPGLSPEGSLRFAWLVSLVRSFGTG
jgi:hypothetical protein